MFFNCVIIASEPLSCVPILNTHLGDFSGVPIWNKHFGDFSGFFDRLILRIPGIILTVPILTPKLDNLSFKWIWGLKDQNNFVILVLIVSYYSEVARKGKALGTWFGACVVNLKVDYNFSSLWLSQSTSIHVQFIYCVWLPR